MEPNIIIEFARIFGFEVDFQRDIRKGDEFVVMYEKYVDDTNKFIQTGSENYLGLVSGMKKGLGGTSQIWGGAMNVNYEKEFIEQCSTELTNFEIEKNRLELLKNIS